MVQFAYLGGGDDDDDNGDCRYCILFTLGLHARPRKFQKYYLFSIGLQKDLDWHSATHLGIGALKVPFQVKLTKMPLVIPKQIFRVSTSNPSLLVIFVNFDKVWPDIDSWGQKKP